MKIIKAAAVSALLCTSILSTPAFAAIDGTADVEDPSPAGITDAAAQAVCTELASVNGPAYTGTLEAGSIDGSVISGPTVNGDRDIDDSSVTGTGNQVAETVQVHGDPFRIGGSVNMFGYASVVAAHWTDSEYDFTAPYTWQSTYSFTCNMTETVPTPALGLHRWIGPSQANEAAQEECVGTQSAHVYDDRGALCVWEQTIPAGTEEQARDDETGSIGPVYESGTLSGHENHGGPIPVNPDAVDIPDVQVVVCISPGKKGGTWTNKNGYTGTNCTTTWYNGGGKIQPSPYDNLNTGSNNVVTIPTS
jgi:hypothetical protein